MENKVSSISCGLLSKINRRRLWAERCDKSNNSMKEDLIEKNFKEIATVKTMTAQ